MGLVDVVSLGVFLHVVHLERHDADPVHDGTRRLRVDGEIVREMAARLQPGEDGLSTELHQIAFNVTCEELILPA